MNRWQIAMCGLAIGFVSLISCGEAQADRDWAVTLYGGRQTDGSLGETVTFNSRFEDAYFVDLGVSRRLYTCRDYVGIEVEGQVARYFGDQHNWEFNLLCYFRWLRFPWDNYLDTSTAVGLGLSYASSKPEIEAKNNAKTAQLLGAVMLEVTFSLPDVPQWALVIGVHHRSGANGTFSGVLDASNAWTTGIRYSF